MTGVYAYVQMHSGQRECPHNVSYIITYWTNLNAYNKYTHITNVLVKYPKHIKDIRPRETENCWVVTYIVKGEVTNPEPMNLCQQLTVIGHYGEEAPGQVWGTPTNKYKVKLRKVCDGCVTALEKQQCSKSLVYLRTGTVYVGNWRLWGDWLICGVVVVIRMKKELRASMTSTPAV